MIDQVTDTENMHTHRHPRHFHLVGIGGSGMSAIAWVLVGGGNKVSGSDLKENDVTAELKAAGVRVFLGHAAANVAGASTVVISSAIGPENPEITAAVAAGIPVLKRAEFLGQLMIDRLGIAVAGTHGKTTTTGMVAEILIQCGLDPSVIVGGTLPSMGRNGRAGKGAPFVVEADEYDYMFLGLHPRISIITNVEHDHPDLFPTRADYVNAFQQFAQLTPSGGTLIGCSDDPVVRSIFGRIRPDVSLIAYGLERPEGDGFATQLRAMELRSNPIGGIDFLAADGESVLGLLRLRVPGEHNVRNALAALAVGIALNIPFAEVRDALATFGGVKRRFQLVGEVADVAVVDDYAHHPTEIRATLAAARQQFPGRRIWAVWQPHTYSRTRLLAEEFAASFEDADRVIALDIYGSREPFTAEINTEFVVQKMSHPYVRYIGKREEASAYVLDRIRPGDVVLTLGAGDGDMVGQWILDGLQYLVADYRQ